MINFLYFSLAVSAALYAAAPTVSAVSATKTNISTNETVTISATVNNGGEATRRIWSSKKDSGQKGLGSWTKDTINSVKWTAPTTTGVYTIGLLAKNGSGQSQGSVDITVANSVPPNFVKIPGSENVNFAGVTPANGWAIMTWEASYSNFKDGQSGCSYGEPYSGCGTSRGNASITSQPNAAPINYVSRNEAETLCSSYLKDGSGNTIANGHVVPLKLWQLTGDAIVADPINWSGNAVGSGFISRGYSDYSNSHASNCQTGTSRACPSLATNPTTNPTEIYQTRAHRLGSGNGWVHDMAGNLYEWFYDTHNNSGNGSWQDLSNLSATALGLRAESIYDSYGASQGLGYIYNSGVGASSSYSAWYGGYWYNITYSGVFTSTWNGNDPASNRHDHLGFRCVVPIQ